MKYLIILSISIISMIKLIASPTHVESEMNLETALTHGIEVKMINYGKNKIYLDFYVNPKIKNLRPRGTEGVLAQLLTTSYIDKNKTKLLLENNNTMQKTTDGILKSRIAVTKESIDQVTITIRYFNADVIRDCRISGLKSLIQPQKTTE